MQDSLPKLFCRIWKGTLASKTKYRLFRDTGLTRAGRLLVMTANEDVSLDRQREALTICKSCYRRLESIEKLSNAIFKVKRFIWDNFTANKSFFSCHKRSRIPVSPRMNVPACNPQCPQARKMQMIATVQSRCVPSLAYKVQSHTCSVQEADSTESAAALAFALTPLSSSEQDCSIQCSLLATPIKSWQFRFRHNRVNES